MHPVGGVVVEHAPRPVGADHHIDRVRPERPPIAFEPDGNIHRVVHRHRPGRDLRLHREEGGVVLPGQGGYRPGGVVPRGDDIAPAPRRSAPARIGPVGGERAGGVESDGRVAVVIGPGRGRREIGGGDLHEFAGIDVPDGEGHVLSGDRVSFHIDDLCTESCRS